MAIKIRKNKTRKALTKMWRNWHLPMLLVECKITQLVWKIVWQFLKWLNIELPIPRLSIYPRELKLSVQGTSLAVQWLGICASTAGGSSSIPGRGTRIPHVMQCSQKLRIKTKTTKCPHKLFTDTHSSIIHNSQKMETPKHPSIDE